MQPQESAKETNQPDQPAVITPESSWQYSPEQDHYLEPDHATAQPVEWTASEFVQHDKDASWFVALAVLGVVIAIVIYLLTKEIVNVVVITMAFILFAVTAKRKPRTLKYQIDAKGITIGGKLYPFVQFKSFTVLKEGTFNSIQLMSLKRFMPPISLYCPPEQEELVIEALSDYLPHEQRDHDAVDRFLNRIRF